VKETRLDRPIDAQAMAGDAAGPQVPAASPADTPAAIVNRAAAIFAERGFEGTTVRDIGKAVGIKSASLYYHFPSKEKIFIAVSRLGVEIVFDAVRSAVEALPANASHRERIGTAVRTHLVVALETGPCTSANIRCAAQLPDEVKREVEVHRRPYEKYWRDLIRAGVAAGEVRPTVDPTLLSLYIFGFMNWALEWFEPGRWTLDAIATQYVDHLFDGVAVREPPHEAQPTAKGRRGAER
jgi:TetR/AcrR family transcriptional regulator, cholesterol catabolism regulator